MEEFHISWGYWGMNRRRSNYSRKKDIIEPEASYLILTEDEKSSRDYINGLLRFFGHGRASKFSVEYRGSSPKSIKAAAELEINNYEMIFCVFDKDTHDLHGGGYTELMRWADTQDKVFAINSVPCFEYWLYLHFQYTDRPIGSAAEAESLLKGVLPLYNKGAVSFSDYQTGLDSAILNSKRSIARCSTEQDDNPMTKMADFIEEIKKIPVR